MPLPVPISGGDAVEWMIKAMVVSHVAGGTELVFRTSGAFPLQTTDSLPTTTVATHTRKAQSFRENQKD